MNYKRNRNKKTVGSCNVSCDESDSSVEEISKGKKKRQRQRIDNSLGELTRNFIKYIRQQGQRDININDLVKKLKVKKRRIYDITNVLEGKIKLTNFIYNFWNNI
jgi:hypothetical protein